MRTSCPPPALRACLFAAFGVSALLTACDKDPPKAGDVKLAPSATSASTSTGSASASPSVAASATAEAKPSGPAKPVITVDDGGALVNGERIDFAQPDAKGRMTAALVGKPMVEGAAVEIEVMRNVKTPRVALAVHAIRVAKAKSVTVKTPNRDRVMTELHLALPTTAPDCSAVGFIGKDRAINAWAVAGGTAARFTKGFAGPDLTLGSAGVRKVSKSCKAPWFFVSAEDTVEWGQTFDLALAVLAGDDAGPPIATDAALLSEAPVPGRKVTWP